MSFGPESILNEKYIYLKTIGSGGFGRAYLAKTKSDDTKVVIKEIELSEMDNMTKKYMVQEGFLLSELKHPNIVDFKNFYFDRNNAYIIMDYADGGDLDIKIKEQKKIDEKFPEGFVVQWFLELCDAIKYIHEQKIIHRDLKPKNIFLTHDYHVKLGDLGIARALDNDNQAKTAIGTQPYLSPEIIEGKPYDFSTDIWDLGIILYEMIELRHPFMTLNPTKMFWNIINVNYDPIEDSQYQQELVDLVPKFLQKEPEKRIALIDAIKILKDCQKNLNNNSNNNDKENKNNFDDYYKTKSVIFIDNNTDNQNKSNPLRKTSSKTYDNGDIYEGEFLEELKDGKGVMKYKGGNKYDGDWKKDKKEGKGIFIYKSGSKYEGDFKNNVKDGHGLFTYKNGDKYDGDFKSGSKAGKGVKYFANGDKYDGEWEEDEYNGNGVFYYHNGDKYVGQFKGGVKEGKGTYYYANGEKKEGTWENDAFLK